MKSLLVFSLLCITVAGCRSGDDQDAKVVVNVSVTKAVAKDVPLTVNAPATVFGKDEAHISARITARVQQVLVHEGEAVKAGQMLAVLEQSDLRAQQADAAAAVRSAQAALERMQHATIPLQVTQARGDLAAKKAALNLAQKVYEKRTELLKEGAISARDLETSQAELAQAQANFEAAQMNLEAVEKHTSAEDLQMAQNALAQIKAKEAFAAANLSFSEIRSPFAGTVTDQLVFPGDLANPGTQLFTVADLAMAVARAQVDPDQVSLVKMGQSCAFRPNQDGEGSVRRGKISVINQAVDPARRTVEVWCQIPNRGGALKSGFFGSVSIEVGTAAHAVVVPLSAIEFQEGTDHGKVYVVDGQHIAHLTQVTAQRLNDQEVRILSGVSAGEVVITTGEYDMPDGTHVSPAGANR